MNHSEEHEKNEEHSDETKFCQNCGSQIDVKAEICSKCGVRVALPEAQAPTSGDRALLFELVLVYLNLTTLISLFVGFIISIIFGIDYLIAVIVVYPIILCILVFLSLRLSQNSPQDNGRG